MKVASLITVALIHCITIPGPIQAKKKPKPNKFCVGKDGNRYKVGEGYDDNDGKACIHYKCTKNKKNKFIMKKGKCVILSVDGEWSDWSGWSECTSTCGDATKIRKRTCSSPPPSDGGRPCPGLKEEIEECSLPSCGILGESVNVTALELNVQSLNESMQTLQYTVQSILELMTTMQSTANKQGTCLSDLSSSDCPSSAAGKVGVVDGIASNTAGVSTNAAGLTSSKAGISLNKDNIASIEAKATKLESCLGDVNSANCPSSKGGKTSVSDAIMENKDAIKTHHQIEGSSPPIKNNGQWRCSGSPKLCTLKCNPGYASLYSTTTFIDGVWVETDKMECSPSVFLLLGGSTESIYSRMTTEADKTTEIYHPQIENLTCSNPLPTLDKTWMDHATFLHNGLVYMCGGDTTKYLCTSLNMTHPTSQWESYNISQVGRSHHVAAVMQNMVYFIGGEIAESMFAPLPLQNESLFSPVPNLSFKHGYHCVVKVDEDCFIITGGIPAYVSSASYLYDDATVIKYNVSAQSVTDLPRQSPRFLHGCVMVEEGDKQWIVVAGGVGLSSTQRLNLDGGAQWESLGDLNGHRDSFGMVETEKGIMAIGGNLFIWEEEFSQSSISLSTVELLNWSTQQWKVLKSSLKTPRHGFSQPLEVPASVFGCYIPTDWTIIQRRAQYGNAENYFYKDFKDYEDGFGSNGELWFGLKKLAALTSDGEWELQVDLTDWDDTKWHAKYGTFSVGPAPTYTLHVGGFNDGESTLGDSMAYHNGADFTARDKDQDSWGGNCAESFKGAWWYNKCHEANLNGLNLAQQKNDVTSINWWQGKARGDGHKSWKESVMKIKRITV